MERHAMYYDALEELHTRLTDITSDPILVGLTTLDMGIVIEVWKDNLRPDVLDVILAVKEKYNLRMEIETNGGLVIRLV